MYMGEDVCLHKRACVQVSLCGFSLLGWISYLAGLHLGGVPLPLGLLHSGQPTFQSCLHQGSDLSVTTGLYFCRRGVFCVPRYSHNALQDSRRWTWGAWRGWAVTGWTVAF